jgi:tagatose-6-phosphate ketose/aldose isomerase
MVRTSAGLAPLAKEASLKILEMTAGRTTAINETFLGVRHGPMSFLRSDTLVFCVLSSDAERRRFEEDVIREIRQKNLGHAVVTGATNPDGELGHDFIQAMAPDLPDDLRGPFRELFSLSCSRIAGLASHLDPIIRADGVITRIIQQFQLY